MKTTVFASAALLVSLLASGVSLAADELHYNLYNFTAEAQQMVENDLMQATLSATHESNRAAEAADTVNQQMQWALSLAKNKKALTVSTGQYHTSPVYKSGKIVAWRASQQLHIETEEFGVLTDLIGDLQQRLKLDAMQFTPTPETRRRTEDALLVKALDQFKTRAKVVAKTMAASNYDIVNLAINTGGYHPPMPQMRMKAFAMNESVADPSVEGGSSAMTVSVTGQIQLRHQ
ncbi:DUF541 domain-containing protein [Exilibacterium tricleocarpae]|uniref:DUF541 domain-containing protein n=1 Tax=Exilibacterium tricleocarpae TaxID=2591008 RepID=A0A545SS42_9GAMM|nr:SIMPL domain-containing protein [Exilibacterium tricleocarpae]TQV67789.1 DUF541 domain-containing protein [Exilibacterium tricleocarpae]